MVEINDDEILYINKKLAELAKKESTRQITEKDYKEQSEKLYKRRYELLQVYIKKEIENQGIQKKEVPKEEKIKKEPTKETITPSINKPTKATKLGDFWG